MGKRRIRNLQSLGYNNIYGFDFKKDRCEEALKKYNISILDSLEDEIVESKNIDVFIISVSPEVHHIYLTQAVRLNIPAFVEASVVDYELKDINLKAKNNNLLIAPSCTMMFHPAVKIISEWIANPKFGKITNIIYHSGQYLPDWHTYEKVEDYYVSKKETGGAREIVPFELTWLTQIFGFPNGVFGINKKLISIEGAPEIDDTYNILLNYNDFILNLNVDVVSRCATRNFTINSSMSQLKWDWNKNKIEIYDSLTSQWDEISYSVSSAEPGYNENISEQMYIEEIKCFVNAVKREGIYPNSLDKDLRVLDILYKSEASYSDKKYMEI
jgi:predicted dehydrogenase